MANNDVQQQNTYSASLSSIWYRYLKLNTDTSADG